MGFFSSFQPSKRKRVKKLGTVARFQRKTHISNKAWIRKVKRRKNFKPDDLL